MNKLFFRVVGLVSLTLVIASVGIAIRQHKPSNNLVVTSGGATVSHGALPVTGPRCAVPYSNRYCQK